ncbi:MAG: hypothetical protein RLZZ104_1542 [Pseudomonadota bacterium]|jgi:hypothetical protein
MTETKFTPGPWKAFFGTENNKVLIGIGEDTGEGITDCGFGLWRGKDEEANANAHLIAAAPELYEALLKLRSAYKSAEETEPNDRDALDKLITDLISVERAADAALAKASGEGM